MTVPIVIALVVLGCLSGVYLCSRKLAHQSGATAMSPVTSASVVAPTAADASKTSNAQGNQNEQTSQSNPKIQVQTKAFSTALPDYGVSPGRLADVVASNHQDICLSLIFFDPADWDHLRDADLEPLKNANSARIIDLSLPHITDKTLEYLKDLPRLTDLSVKATRVTTLAPLRNAKLQKLDLSETRLDRSAYIVLASMKELKKLQLKKCSITDADLKFLYGLKSLQLLELYDCANLTQAKVDLLQNNLLKCSVGYFPFIDADADGHKLLMEAVDLGKQKKFLDAGLKAAEALAVYGPRKLAGNEKVDAYELRGDCLIALKLPLAAYRWYEPAARLYSALIPRL